MPLAGRIAKGEGNAGRDQGREAGLMVPRSFPTVATPAPDGGGAVRNNALASIKSKPKTVVLLLAGARGEYGELSLQV